MKYILGVLIALLAMAGMATALNSQPEPPAQVIGEMGQITITDTTVTIDMGQVYDPQASLKETIGLVETAINDGKLDAQKTYVVTAGGLAMTLNAAPSTEKIKKTDHLGTYHFKSLSYSFRTSGPYSQSTSNIEDN